jgi:membrane-associated phospholipid phosphatase
VRQNTTNSPGRYLLAGVCIVAAFIVLYVYFVRTESGQQIDQLAYNGADFGWRSVTPVTRRLLDALPGISGVIGFVLTVVIVLVRRNWTTFVVALAAAAAAAASTQILKYAILTRPDLGVEGFADNSFPSGHTTVAAASALAVFLVSSARTRPIVAGLGSAYTVIAGASTLANQWHRPSDVIAALLVVAFWGCAAGFLLAVLVPGRAEVRATSRSRLLLWLLGPFVVVAAIAFVLTLINSTKDDPDTVIAYIGGVAAIIAVGFTLAVMAVRTFARLP